MSKPAIKIVAAKKSAAAKKKKAPRAAKMGVVKAKPATTVRVVMDPIAKPRHFSVVAIRNAVRLVVTSK